MALRKWEGLRQEELFRADIMGLRAMMAIMLKEMLDGTQDRDAAAKKLRDASEHLIRMLPASAIPPARQPAYVEAAVDSAHRLIENALSIHRIDVPNQKH